MWAWFLKLILKRLTSLAVDGWSLEWRQLWHWAEVYAREPGGPEESDSWDWTIAGDRVLTGESGISGELETWQPDGEEEGGPGDLWGLGNMLQGEDGSLCGVWVQGEWCSLLDTEAEASWRLWANRALLVLAELIWIASLVGSGRDLLGSGSIGLSPGWSLSLSEELSITLDLCLSSQLPSLSFVFFSSSPLLPKSESWWSFSLAG